MRISYEPLDRTATGPFGYSVQSNLSSLFFDFDRRVFRRYLDIVPKARSAPLVCRDGRWVGDFNHMDDDGVYSVCVRDASDSYRVVSKHTRVCGNFQRLTLPTVDERERERVAHRQSAPSQPTKFQATKKPDVTPKGAVLIGDANKPDIERALALRMPTSSAGLKQVDIDAVDLLVLHRVLYHDDGTPTPAWVSFEQIWSSVWVDGYGIYYSKEYVQGHIETSLLRLYHKGRIKVQNGLLYRSDEPRMSVRCQCGHPNYGVPTTQCPNCGKEYTHRMDYRPPNPFRQRPTNPFRQRPTSSVQVSRPAPVEQPMVVNSDGLNPGCAFALFVLVTLIGSVVSGVAWAAGSTSGWVIGVPIVLGCVFVVWLFVLGNTEAKVRAEKEAKAKPLSDHPLYEPFVDASFKCIDVTK